VIESLVKMCPADADILSIKSGKRSGMIAPERIDLRAAQHARFSRLK
jgi:hypothetical protein